MNKPAVSVAVFANNKRTNEKAPQKTGVIEFNEDMVIKAGTKLELSLWERTANSGMQYESGYAKPQWQGNGSGTTQNNGPRNRGAEERGAVKLDW